MAIWCQRLGVQAIFFSILHSVAYLHPYFSTIARLIPSRRSKRRSVWYLKILVYKFIITSPLRSQKMILLVPKHLQGSVCLSWTMYSLCLDDEIKLSYFFIYDWASSENKESCLLRRLTRFFVCFSEFEGIDDQSSDTDCFGRKLLHFHSSPVVMITYQFVSLRLSSIKFNYAIACDFIVHLHMVLTRIQLLDVVSNEIFWRSY